MDALQKIKYSFSGHESFYCKSIWLKKGFDFVSDDRNFNSPDSVLHLGVGKNMVSSIRFWLRAFGMIEEDELTEMASYIFDSESGKDPYIEDLRTTWLLHYLIIASDTASIYKLLFIDFQREHSGEFTREQLHLFLKRKTSESDFPSVYNENTIKRDIGVLLQNYSMPKQDRPNEDFSAVFIDLSLIKESEKDDYSSRQSNVKSYHFNIKGKMSVASDLFLYAILDSNENEQIISFESLLDLALIFCMSKTELVDVLTEITRNYPDYLRYSDDAGIKQLFILKEIDKKEVLEQYYS